MDYHKLSDEQLVAYVARRDGAALACLYDRHAAAVMGLALRIIHDRATAEEAVQETFWRVWCHAGTFQAGRTSFRSWLFTIARRLAIDTLRRRQVRPQPPRNEIEVRQMNGRFDPQTSVPEAALLEIRREQIRAAITELPPEQLNVIELAYFQGLTRQEIAQATGIPLGTVHTRSRLGLQKLREMLNDEPSY